MVIPANVNDNTGTYIDKGSMYIYLPWMIALLGAGLSFDDDRAICFSSERADQATAAANGIDDASAWLGRPVPEVYSGALSEFVFAAGVKLLTEWRPDVMYLSTTDYIQHKFAPDEDGALRFNAMVDGHLGKLDEMGAVIVLTADHGCDPTWRGSDHTREQVPALFVGPGVAAGDLGQLAFADVGATLSAHLGLAPGRHGTNRLTGVA